MVYRASAAFVYDAQYGSGLSLCLRLSPRRQYAHVCAGLNCVSASQQAGYSGNPEDVDNRKNPELYASIAPPKHSVTSSLGAARFQPAASVSHSPHTQPVQQAAGALHKPEVLSPAGGWPQLQAAVENGADAVYFGLTEFNARARADNFDDADLPAVMSYLHQRGVKGYVTLNVLVFDEELEAVEGRIRSMASAGVDAVIVQDVGVVQLIRRVAPGLSVHGSTQMSITTAEGAAFAQQLGVGRVVVGRELSIGEIGRVHEGSSVEVEAFVHGALCVSYSGQCYSSEAWGGRSANRGQCAQACRLPYGLLVNGVLQELGDLAYLLSPQDLMALDLVPQLIECGVTCFKIEGRLKGPEYTALTTQVYRKAVDAAWEELQRCSVTGVGSSDMRRTVDGSVVQDLRQLFSRAQDASFDGLTPGFLEGVQHQRLVRGRSPRHRGVYVGRVLGVSGKGAVLVEVEGDADVKRGDGLVFQSVSGLDNDETGGCVFDVAVKGTKRQEGSRIVQLVFGQGQLDYDKVKVDQMVWRTKDPALEARIRRSYEAVSQADSRKLPVAVTVTGQIGQPLVVTLQLSDGRHASGVTHIALTAATNRPISLADIAGAIGQLGSNTLAVQGEIDYSGLDTSSDMFIPLSAVKAARRRAVELMLELIRLHGRDEGMAAGAGCVVDDMIADIKRQSFITEGEGKSRDVSTARLRVLCRSAKQVEAALQLAWLDEIVLDFLEVHGLKEAVQQVRSSGCRVVVATPRILKPDEHRLWVFYLKLQPDALLVRSAGLLYTLNKLGGPGAVVEDIGVPVPRLEGDFGLNAANVLSAHTFLSHNLDCLAPTHDLNAQQICNLAKSMGPRSSQLEVIVHQHMPLFHTEHCVFARFLSSGNSYLDCGHPCEKNNVHLRDDTGKDHLVLADMGCRNTVFNSQAQSGLFHLPELMCSGCRLFRIELVDEPPEFVIPLLQGYADVLIGRQRPSELWRWMQQLPDSNGCVGGVASGSLQVKVERSAASLRPTARR